MNVSDDKRTSAAWWLAFARASNPGRQVVGLEAQLRETREHLERLVAWGWGNDAPDDARRDWRAAQAYLAERQHAA